VFKGLIDTVVKPPNIVTWCCPHVTGTA